MARDSEGTVFVMFYLLNNDVECKGPISISFFHKITAQAEDAEQLLSNASYPLSTK